MTRLYRRTIRLPLALAALWAAFCCGCGPQDDSPSVLKKGRSAAATEIGKKLMELGAEVKEEDGKVVYVDFYLTRKTDEGLPLLAEAPHVKFLVLSGARMSDEELKHLQGLSELEELALNNTQITDAGLAQLTGFSRLKKLNLNDTQISDEGLAHVGKITSLEGLNMQATQITDAGLEHLAQLKNLRHAWLGVTKVTNSGADKLRKALPSAKILPEDMTPPSPSGVPAAPRAQP